jgi:hypothetical protein
MRPITSPAILAPRFLMSGTAIKALAAPGTMPQPGRNDFRSSSDPKAAPAPPTGKVLFENRAAVRAEAASAALPKEQEEQVRLVLARKPQLSWDDAPFSV